MNYEFLHTQPKGWFKVVRLPFGSQVRIGYTYYHHRYPTVKPPMSKHRFVFQPFIVFDPPRLTR